MARGLSTAPPRARGATRAACLLAVAFGALACASTAYAVCKEPLPSADLHALDALATTDPVAADRQAKSLLESTRDAARRAQLHAIRADAYSTTGEDSAALREINDGRAQLELAGAFEGADRVGLRLALVEADATHGREQMRAIVDGLDRWRDAAQRQPIGRACLLLVRSRVLSRLGMHEQSARDGLEAHAIAVGSGSDGAISETHFQLGTAFRRAGLFDMAMPHADATIALERIHGETAALSSAMYLKAQVLGDAGLTAQAREMALESRRISLALADEVSAGFANHILCGFELQLGNLREARARCDESRRTFVAAGRDDMLAEAEEYEARIDMAEDKPAAALARLQRVLRNDGGTMPPVSQSRAYRSLADAQAGLGRAAEALESMRKSLSVEEADHQLQRSLAAALTLAQFDRQAQERREARLAGEVRAREAQVNAASTSRAIAWSLFGASVVIIGLLLALLSASRRNARVLRQQEALFRAATENSSDAVALLTADGRVRFSSRDLFGRGNMPQQQRPLLESVPIPLREAMHEVMNLLLEDGIAVERDLRVEGGDGGPWRDIELRGHPIIESGRLIGATLRTRDITQRRAVERSALEWLDRSREKAGGGLHEGLAQELVGVSMSLGAIANAQRSGRVVAPDTLEASIAQLSGAIETTRGMASELSPLVVGRGSLQDALARLATDASRRLEVPVRFMGTWDPLPELGRAGELLYRIAELALLAPGPSSGLLEATIWLESAFDGVHLVLDARGGPNASEPQGLQLIRYLATLLGASTHFEHLEESGWRLRVAVPPSGLSR